MESAGKVVQHTMRKAKPTPVSNDVRRVVTKKTTSILHRQRKGIDNTIIVPRHTGGFPSSCRQHEVGKFVCYSHFILYAQLI